MPPSHTTFSKKKKNISIFYTIFYSHLMENENIETKRCKIQLTVAYIGEGYEFTPLKLLL